jgi:hypothetical protein
LKRTFVYLAVLAVIHESRRRRQAGVRMFAQPPAVYVFGTVPNPEQRRFPLRNPEE